MKKYIYGFLGLALALCVALTIVPHFINWDHYKPLAQEYVRSALGRDLTIEGPIRIAIFPTPHVVIKQVRLSNPNGASTPDMIKVAEIDVYASLLSLLRGHIKLSKALLVEPDIFLEQDTRGHNNWTFDTTALAAKESSLPSSSPQKTSAAVKMETLKIERGRLSYKSGDQTYTVSDVNAFLGGDIEKGPAHLKADFLWKNLPVKMQINLKSLANMRAIPLESLVTVDGHSLKTTGDYDVTNQAFTGDIVLHIDSKVLPAASHALFKQPLILTGHLVVNPERLLLTPLHLTSGALDAHGSATIGLAANAPHEITVEKLPGSTSLRLKGYLNATPAQEWQGTAVFSSANAIAFFDWLQLPRVPSLTENMKGLTLQFNYALSPTHMGISGLNARTGDTQLAGALAWANQRLTVDIKTPSLTPLLGLAGIPAAFKGGEAALKGTFQGDLQSLQFDTNMQLMGGSFLCKGQISDPLANLRYKVTLQGNHPNINRLLAGLGHELKGFRLGAARMLTQLTGAADSIAIQKLEGSLQPRHKAYAFSAKGSLNLKGKRPQVKGDIQFADMNLNDFFPSTQLSGNPYGRPMFLLASHRSKSIPQASKWSSEPIDFSALQSFEGTVGVKASSFTASRYTVKNLSAELKNTADVLTIAPLKADVFKGTLSGSLHLTNEASPSLRLALTCHNGSLDHFLESSPHEKVIDGIFDLGVDLSSRGRSPRDIISQLNGKIDLDVRDGIIYGFDLDAISQNLQKLRDVPAFLNLLQTFMQKGKTRFSSFKAVFDVQQGVAQSKIIKLLAPAGTGQGQGYVDLVRWWTRADATFKLTKPESLPPFAMHMEGPLDNPQRSVDTQRLQNYLFENFASKALGKIVPKKYRDFLPFLSPDSPQQPSGDQQSEQEKQGSLPIPKPEKELKKALENLLGF